MLKSRDLMIGLVILIMIGFFVWALLPKDDYTGKIKATIKSEKKKADIVFNDATFAEVYDGVKYWELVAKHSTINKSIGIADLYVVDGLFFDNGQPTLKFLAPSAKWKMNKNDILLNDPIGYDVKYEKFVKTELEKVKDITRLHSFFHLPNKLAKSNEGYWFSAKNLDWRLSTKKLLCSGEITLTKGDMRINSENLESDVGMDKVLLTGHPSGEIFSGAEKTDIFANTFLIDSKHNIITADQNVQIFRNGSKISSAKAVYDQKNRLMKLFGDVFIDAPELKAYSRDASYDLEKDLVLLLDKAKALRNGNEVYGEKMSILLGQNRIIIEGRAKAKIKEREIR